VSSDSLLTRSSLMIGVTRRPVCPGSRAICGTIEPWPTATAMRWARGSECPPGFRPGWRLAGWRFWGHLSEASVACWPPGPRRSLLLSCSGADVRLCRHQVVRPGPWTTQPERRPLYLLQSPTLPRQRLRTRHPSRPRWRKRLRTTALPTGLAGPGRPRPRLVRLLGQRLPQTILHSGPSLRVRSPA
jgi:hypothetical protein